MNQVKNILLTGVGGQGNVLAARLIINVAMAEGYEATNAEIYGSSQRGGSVTSHIRIFEQGEYGPLVPEGSADIIVGLEPVEVMKCLKKFGNPSVKVILDPSPSAITNLMGRVMDYPDIDEIIDACEKLSQELRVVEATELAEELGAPVVHNMILVGCLTGSGWIPLSSDSFKTAIRTTFSGETADVNLKALEKGIEVISGE